MHGLVGCALASLAGWAAGGLPGANAQESTAAVAKPQFSPYAGRNYPTRVLWGDTHLHTAISVDAGTMYRVGQEDAYRFARGEEITTTHGLRAKLSRPLDFLVIADHAEMYGLMPQLLGGDPELLATESGKKWHTEFTSGDNDRMFATAMEIVGSLSGDVPPIKNDKAVRNAWQAYTALADKYNEPGRFTALIGFEWTAIGGDNLHRNVVFRDDASVANQHRAVLPVRQQESGRPLEPSGPLRKADRGRGARHPPQRQLEQRPHVHDEDVDGKPLTRELATMRAQYEPLIEATQIKGDGEAHPFLSPNDEFADYEKWDRSNLNGTEAKQARDAAVGVRARGAQERPVAREEAGCEPVQVRLGGQHRLRTPSWRPSKRTTSSASIPASSRNRTAGSTWSSRPRIRSSR